MRRLSPILLLLALLAGAAAAGGAPRPVLADDHPVPPPAPRSTSLAEEIIDKTFSYPLGQLLDAPHMVRRLIGRPYEALNVDAFDEVPNSSWFTHRNARVPMSAAAVGDGAGGAGPDTAGTWRVIAFKSAGVTPGMTIVDARGDRYVIKFDPPGYEGLASGAEVVASRLLHAAGYNVPENHITWVDPERLRSGVEAVHEQGTPDKRRPLRQAGLTESLLADLVRRVTPHGEHRVRALASRFLDGRILGPFPYVGTRADDANDRYPHEHRRELRGLYVLASWINHADMKEENTLDVYDPERRVVVHYLIDFGASLGSNSTHPSNPRRGQANSFDLGDAFVRLATFGLYVFDYERAPSTVAHPAVGYLGNELFDPGAWKPMYPAPPFDRCTPRDAFWGARLVTSFTDAQIEAAVDAARYPPPAARALRDFLRERRDRIGRYWFARTNPLDGFGLVDDTLTFTDLAVARGYASATGAVYTVEVRTASGESLFAGIVDEPRLALSPDWRRAGELVVSLQPQRPGHRGKALRLEVASRDGGWQLRALRR